MPSAPASAPQSPLGPRLSLPAVRAARAVLDGGWWPRSLGAAVELPGLVLALDERYGSIRRRPSRTPRWRPPPTRPTACAVRRCPPPPPAGEPSLLMARSAALRAPVRPVGDVLLSAGCRVVRARDGRMSFCHSIHNDEAGTVGRDLVVLRRVVLPVRQALNTPAAPGSEART